MSERSFVDRALFDREEGERLDLGDPKAQVWYFPMFLTPDEADDALEHCLNLDWDQEHITLFGKTHPVPRLSSWHGDPGASYRYANIRMEPKPWVPVLSHVGGLAAAAVGTVLAAGASGASDARPVVFNSVLANLYRHGRDRAAWHADDEPELGADPVIASVSLGATRRFRFRAKDPQRRHPGSTTTVDLGHGSLVVMAGATQSAFQHEITKTAKVVGPRVNLTYRQIRSGDG